MTLKFQFLKSRKIKNALAVSALFMLLNACAPHIDVPTVNEADTSENAKVSQAPQLEGSWISACQPDSATSGDGIQKRYTFRGEELVRETLHFPNATKCAGMPIVTTLNPVHFTALTQSRDNVYQLEYQSTYDPQTPLVYQYVKVIDSKMFISAEHYVKGVPDQLTTVLQKAPPAPAVGPAIKATSWLNARYAFCSNQGIATLIDLSNSNLMSHNVRLPRFKQWRCYSAAPNEWQAMNGGVFSESGRIFSLQLQSRARIDIHESGFSGSYKQFPYSYSTVFGNSGECFFIQSEATQNLNFDFACE